MKKTVRLACLLGLGTLASAALAQQGHPPPHRGPPPEAFTACQDKAENDSCEVTLGERGTIQGKCGYGRGPSQQLACLPPRPRPPQEAFDACNGKAEGAACSVTLHDHTLEGKCANTPDASLVCRPSHLPQPPP